MKLKKLLFAVFIMASFVSFSQRNPLSTGSLNFVEDRANLNPNGSIEKTLVCEDTVNYPLTKEFTVGTETLYIWELWTDDAEAISQKYELSGTSISVSGVEVFGRMDPSMHPGNGGPGSLTIEAAIYSVDANNNPLTQLTSSTINITDTTWGFRYVDFASPLAVSGDYAVVIQPTTPGGIFQLYINDVVASQTYDEDLSRITSTYYDGSNGNWVSIPVFAGSSQWTLGNIDFEALMGPIISYTIDPAFTTDAPQCVNDAVSFTNNATPQSILSSRFYTYQKYTEYWGISTSDSTFVYDVGDGSPLYWEQNPSHAYTNDGSYTGTQYVLGGFRANCLDFVSETITIDPLDDASVAYAANEFCSTSANQTPTINSTGTFTATPAGLVFADASTGEIDIASSTPGTYDITFQTNGTCPNSSTVTIGINDPATAGFSYAQASYCVDAGTASATLDAGAIAGTFSSAAGLSVDGFTGDVDVANSTPGTYTVTNTVAGSGGCSQITATETIEIAALDDASFAYSSNTLCLGGANETPTINETGTFTATPAGLVFADASTGEIDMVNSSANTYTIEFSTSGTCPNSSTQSVTLTTSPDATFSYSAAEFCAEVGTESPTFPNGASAGTFTATPAGLSLNGNSGAITLDASSANTYTVTNTIAASGSCPQTTALATVTINALPTVVGGADETVCEGTQVTLTATGADTYMWTGGISQGTAFTPSLGATTYTVTGTDLNNCENTDDVIVTVDEEPVVDAGADQAVCEGNEITLTATTSVGSISWNNGINDGVAFLPTATTTYTATATNGVCSITDDVIVTVNALPSVTVGADETTCVNYSPIALTGTPTGGTFSGPGVTGTEFDPSTAGVGSHTITYTYQDGNGCENSATQIITVDGCASIKENSMDAIVVAPNPATSFVNIEVSSSDIENIQLVNSTGKVINTNVVIESTMTRVDLDNVAKGTYFLQINTVFGQTTKKLIVQ